VQLIENALVTRFPINEGIGPDIRICIEQIEHSMMHDHCMIIACSYKAVEKRYKYHVSHR